MIRTRTILLMVSVALAAVSQAAQPCQASGELRANAQNEIVLDQPAIVANTWLPAGTYKVHSKASGTAHQVYFMRETKLETVFPQTSSVVVYEEAARINSETKLRDSTAKVTTLHYVEQDGSMRIVSAEIKGESHSHVF